MKVGSIIITKYKTMELNYKITALLDGNKLDEFVSDCREILDNPTFLISCGEEKDVDITVSGLIKKDGAEWCEIYFEKMWLEVDFQDRGWKKEEFKITLD